MKTIQKMNVFQQGLIWGILLGVLELLLNALGNVIHFTALTLPILILSIVVYVCVGVLAAQKTGRTGSGAIVGLLTGTFSALITAIETAVITLSNVDAERISAQNAVDKLLSNAHSTAHIHYTNSLIIAQNIGIAVAGIVLALVIGVIFGAIGGSIGKGRGRKAPLSDYA